VRLKGDCFACSRGEGVTLPFVRSGLTRSMLPPFSLDVDGL
jgi:hypothetical protein